MNLAPQATETRARRLSSCTLAVLDMSRAGQNRCTETEISNVAQNWIYVEHYGAHSFNRATVSSLPLANNTQCPSEESSREDEESKSCNEPQTAPLSTGSSRCCGGGAGGGGGDRALQRTAGIAGEGAVDPLVDAAPLKVPVLEALPHGPVGNDKGGPRLVFQSLAVNQTRVSKYSSGSVHSGSQLCQELLTWSERCLNPLITLP